MGLYQDLLKTGVSEDEVADIFTNLLACASNSEDLIPTVERLADGFKFDKTYEYFFNQSQVEMKQELHQQALQTLLKSFAIAREDGAEHAELTRFKVQEMHTLNSFYQEFN